MTRHQDSASDWFKIFFIQSEARVISMEFCALSSDVISSKGENGGGIVAECQLCFQIFLILIPLQGTPFKVATVRVHGPNKPANHFTQMKIIFEL